MAFSQSIGSRGLVQTPGRSSQRRALLLRPDVSTVEALRGEHLRP